MNDSHWPVFIGGMMGVWVPCFFQDHPHYMVSVVLTGIIFILGVGISIGSSK